MEEAHHQIAELAVALFYPNVEHVGSVQQASRHILRLYAALSDIDKGFGNLASNGSAQSLVAATTGWQELHPTLASLVIRPHSSASFQNAANEKEISWKKVQILSRSLQLHAAQLRESSGKRLEDADTEILLDFPRSIRQLKHELQQLQIPTPVCGKAVPAHHNSSYLEKAQADAAAYAKLQFKYDAQSIQYAELQADLDNANSEVEKSGLKEAAALVQRAECDDAVLIYEKLYNTREAERTRKIANGDNVGANTSEKAALGILHEWAITLKTQGKLFEAERMVRFVWASCETWCGKNHESTRRAQRELCFILRAYDDERKYKEAEDTYRPIWNSRDRTANLTDVWIMENGHELGMVLIEQGLDLEAERPLREVLGARKRTLTLHNVATIDTAEEYVNLLLRTHPPEDAAKALQPFLEKGVDLPPRIVANAKKIGKVLSARSSYEAAENMYKPVWQAAKTNSNASIALEVGWELSRVLFQGEKYHDAKKVLNDLQQLHDKHKQSDARSLVHISILLSWTCRNINDWSQAEKFARLVWKYPENEANLGPRYSVAANLIWILFMDGKEKKDRLEAREIWHKIRDAKKVVLKSCTDLDKQETAVCWEALAEHVQVSCRSRGTTPTTAIELREEARALRRACKAS